MVFGLVTDDRDVMSLFMFLHGLTLNVDAYIKFLEEIPKSSGGSGWNQWRFLWINSIYSISIYFQVILVDISDKDIRVIFIFVEFWRQFTHRILCILFWGLTMWRKQWYSICEKWNKKDVVLGTQRNNNFQFLRWSLLIFIIKGFRTIVFILIVISTTFRTICPPPFFRCLSNSGTFTELQTTSFIYIFIYIYIYIHIRQKKFDISSLLTLLAFFYGVVCNRVVESSIGCMCSASVRIGPTI